MTRAAAFFDLDKTVIARSSALAFGRPLYRRGLINRRAVLASTYAQLLFVVGGADADQLDRLRDHMAAMCAGWEVATVREIVAETLHEMIDPLIYAEALELIAGHRAAGHDVVIVSGSGAELVGPIGELLGADQVIATEMAVLDGRYTGEVAFSAYGPAKAAAIRDLSARRGYLLADSFAYSDSATDLPMLELVGHPTAVNPDRTLRRAALERGWPVRDFARPVRLHSRLGRPDRRTSALAGAALGIAVAAVGLAWAGRRAAR